VLSERLSSRSVHKITSGRLRRSVVLSSAVTNIEALKSAARAAIVMPAVFGFADQVIGNAQTSIFAAFGSFAVLVLVEFGGLPRARLIAYLVFTTVGVALITLGTLCSRDAWLAAGATGAVGFLTLFSGAFSGYLAAASTGAILLFVLPANIASPNSVIPDRLLGFALAAGVGTAASLLLWPARRRADLRRSVAAAMRSVVELIEAGPAEQQASAAASRTAVDGLRRSSLGSQHRPAGPTGATAALAALPDELDWLLSFLEPPLALTSPDDAEAMASAAAVLRASIDRLEGGSAQADFDRLERGRDDVARAFIRQLPELPPSADPAVLPEMLDTPFRVRAATYAARQVGLYAMRATDGNVPSDVDTDLAAARGDSFDAARQLALEHASPRSVWLRNSTRGAVALALATYIAQRATLQHGFWVVLGTLSVLRSNALGTGSTIVNALAGTAVGIVAGALLVIAIGTHHAALWAMLPLAVFLAAYAPRAISFAASSRSSASISFCRPSSASLGRSVPMPRRPYRAFVLIVWARDYEFS
jgi:fusaric acid resistance family protein